ncbi:SDR family oxidoreductase [Sphingomonas canadensis]|uniref:SDR family oxidoreductase n=1 Tax=Sphingomonas canadensis TaxID=1219257 RepID=A0ABW3HCH4_9SPHN|nr:SDR family oxidoreductase [Sphingomonas canadensis]MCW3837615.1 SDR family oxidoreductase [Sphingomonas canadensis]
MAYVQGRVVVVTGASAGLGRAVAIAFAEAGARLVLGARRKDRLDALVAEIEGLGAAAVAVACDVRDEGDVAALFQAGMDRFGRIDVLINNAGVADHTPTDQLTAERWREVIDTNLTGAFFCAREAFRIMRGQGAGRIIHIGSLSAITPRPNTAAYAASKFALSGLNHSLAIDGRAHGIASSIFHPGIVGTELGGGSAPPADPSPGRTIGADVAARAVLAMADLPDHVNFVEGTMLPNTMPFLGRG